MLGKCFTILVYFAFFLLFDNNLDIKNKNIDVLIRVNDPGKCSL